MKVSRPLGLHAYLRLWSRRQCAFPGKSCSGLQRTERKVRATRRRRPVTGPARKISSHLQSVAFLLDDSDNGGFWIEIRNGDDDGCSEYLLVNAWWQRVYGCCENVDEAGGSKKTRMFSTATGCGAGNQCDWPLVTRRARHLLRILSKRVRLPFLFLLLLPLMLCHSQVQNVRLSPATHHVAVRVVNITRVPSIPRGYV